MAPFRPSNASVVLWALLLAAGGLAHAIPARTAGLGTCRENIVVEADNLGANLRRNDTELTNVEITGCDTRINAQRARFSQLDFEDSSWTFDGDVRIEMNAQQGRLSSDRAVVTFRDNQVQRVAISGSPAQFQQKRTDSNAIARGRAGEIVYALGDGTVTLSNDAWLTDGSTEIQGSQLVYNIRQQQVQASSVPGNKSRVRLTITPKSDAKDDKKTPPANPAP